MKKILLLLLALSLLLCGCGNAPAETVPTTEAPTTEATTEATTEPATEPTTAPTEPPIYYNPLNGEQLDTPYTGRVIASIVSNTSDAIPHAGVNEADILFEIYASYGVARCLALYSDISDVEAMGSVRSTRLVFNDLTQHYDAILFHAGGYSTVMQDAADRGIEHYNLDSLYRRTDPLAAATAYRTDRRYSPHNLYGYGPGILEYIEGNEIRNQQPEDKSYNLNFLEDGTPADGEQANWIHFWFGPKSKDTTMHYDETLGKYIWEQYWGKIMHDEVTGEVESFENVLILKAVTGSIHVFQTVDFVAGGEGYFACNGRIIPILWGCDDEDSPLWFTTLDGQPLNLGVGNTYIGIIDQKNELTYGTGETA